MIENREQFLDFDPEKIQTFADLISNLSKKSTSTIREKGFKNYLKHNKHNVFEYQEGNIYVIMGAKYNKTEFHIAEKLTKAGYHVLFPNDGDMGKGRKKAARKPLSRKTTFRLLNIVDNTPKGIRGHSSCRP
jgi:hypothetical protein